MKKLVTLLFISVFLAPCFSQDDSVTNESDKEVKEERSRKKRNHYGSRDVITLFGPHAGSGGYGAVSMGYTEVDGRSGLLIGGRGEWIIGHGLGLGVGGYGLINEPQFNVNDNVYYNLAGGYGGFIMEPILFGRWPVHLSFPILIGAGGVALTSFNEDFITNFDPYDSQYNDAFAFFVAEPGAELEFNLVRWMRLSVFYNYRYTSKLISTGTINENALNGWSAGITLKVGSF